MGPSLDRSCISLVSELAQILQIIWTILRSGIKWVMFRAKKKLHLPVQLELDQTKQHWIHGDTRFRIEADIEIR